MAIVGLLISGCATLPAAPDADEHALAARADKEEETFLKRATVYVEPLLVGYLAAVADRLTPGFRLIVLRDPTLNAFALPNRHVFLHTGLLSRVENESQLAMIIAREMAHVTAGHARATARDGQPARVVYTTVDEPTANAMLGSGLVLSARAAITGYGSDLERDADVAGMESVMRVGYDARQAPAVFARLRSDLEERGPLEVFYFGSSARLTERIETTEQLLKTRYAHAPAPSTMVDTEPFQLRMRSVVRENAYEDIRAGRFSLAQRQLDRVLAQTPNDPVAHMYAGDLHRLRAQRAADAATRDQDARLALAAYEKAVELDPTAAEPHRQLGFLYYQQKDNAKARAAFERYLALQPTGLDAKRVREYLAELTRSR